MSGERKNVTRWRTIAFGVAIFVTFAFGFPFLSRMFEAHFSRGLAFVLTAAAMMFIFFIFASLFGLQRELAPLNDKNYSNSPALRILLSLDAIAAAASWGACAYIETKALSQPDHATGVFTVAVYLKSVVRYMTPEQHIIDQIATWTFFGCVFVLLVAGLAVKVRQRLRGDA
jgi:Na+/melibiose symporter-like transporter